MVFTNKLLVIADSLEELHHFAGQVGLDRLCFSEGGLGGHYVLTSPEIVELVIESGAKVLERADFCEKCLEGFSKL